LREKRLQLWNIAMLASVIWMLLTVVAFCQALYADNVRDSLKWYKGSIHCHSFWSDGDDFPELVVDWYKRHGYDFVAMSEHNKLQQGEQWRDLHPKDKAPISEAVLENCRKRFGANAVALREHNGRKEARLKTYKEIRKLLEEPGRFILLENQEISDKFEKGKIYKNVHLNAVNAGEDLPPQGGGSVLDVLRRDLRMVDDYAKRSGRRVVVQVNHPTWENFDVSAADLASAVEARFFEICNNSPDSKYSGDAEHPGGEKIWDIANTLRIAHFHRPPLMGTASDDAHNYHEFNRKNSNPGRGWVVVRAAELTPDALMKAMQQGDFYASIGIRLKDYHYDPKQKRISVEVEPERGAAYTIEFVGTKKNVTPGLQPLAEGKLDIVKMPTYPRFGEVFKTVSGTKAAYQLTGDELYVRAVIRSTKKLKNPADNAGGEYQKAWTQPVGW
jgi:hypothetical protein